MRNFKHFLASRMQQKMISLFMTIVLNEQVFKKRTCN